MSVFFPLSFVVLITISFFLLAFLAFVKNPKSKINRIFAILTILLGTWGFVSYNVDLPYSIEVSSVFLRFDFAIGCLIGASLLLFSLNFPQHNNFFKFNIDKPVLVIGVVMGVLAFTPLTITNIRLSDGFVQYDYGILGEILELFILVTLVFAVLNLVLKYRKLLGREKVQLKFVLFGLTLTIIAALTTNVILPQLIETPPIITRIGIFGTAFMIGFTFYAIAKHRLLDIKFIIARTVAYSSCL